MLRIARGGTIVLPELASTMISRMSDGLRLHVWTDPNPLVFLKDGLDGSLLELVLPSVRR